MNEDYKNPNFLTLFLGLIIMLGASYYQEYNVSLIGSMIMILAVSLDVRKILKDDVNERKR